MPISFAQQSTFVELPHGVDGLFPFAEIVKGETPAGGGAYLQDECYYWCKKNLRGHFGAQEIENGYSRHKLMLGVPQRMYSYVLWFEHLEDAIHFKLRWF